MRCGRSPVTRGRSVAEYPLPHGPSTPLAPLPLTRGSELQDRTVRAHALPTHPDARSDARSTRCRTVPCPAPAPPVLWPGGPRCGTPVGTPSVPSRGPGLRSRRPCSVAGWQECIAHANLESMWRWAGAVVGEAPTKRRAMRLGWDRAVQADGNGGPRGPPFGGLGDRTVTPPPPHLHTVPPPPPSAVMCTSPLEAPPPPKSRLSNLA